MLCCPKSDLKWNGGEERVGSGVKTQLSDVEKPFFVQFCLVLSFVAIVKKTKKKIEIFQYLGTLELPLVLAAHSPICKIFCVYKFILIRKESLKNFALRFFVFR